jgi:hypothetical protein
MRRALWELIKSGAYWGGMVVCGAAIAGVFSALMFAASNMHADTPRPVITLYVDQWTCTKPSQELDALGRVMCDQFTAKVSK